MGEQRSVGATSRPSENGSVRDIPSTDTESGRTDGPGSGLSPYFGDSTPDPQLSTYERFLYGINRATARLLAGATIGDSDIIDTLRLLGEATGVERVHVYRHHAGASEHGYATQEYEWASAPHYSLADRPELLKTPWRGEGETLYARLVEGEPVFMRVDVMPDRERRIPGRMGNKTTIILPIRTRGKLWGHIAFNAIEIAREWSQLEVASLSTVANALGSAIDRIHLERQLAESLAENIVRSQRAEERFRLLTESMKDVLYVYDVELDRFTYVSPSVREVSRYTPQEIRGMSFDDIVAVEHREMVRAFVQEHFENFIESGKIQGEYLTIELDFQDKPGDNVPVEAVARFQREPVSGRVELVGAARDVSERRAMTRALAQSEEHFRLLAENSMDVVLRLDRGSVVRWASPSLQEAVGWSPKQWLGKDIATFLHPEDRGCFEEARLRVAHGEPTVTRFRIRSADDRFRWVEVHAKRYEMVDREEIGAVATFRVVDSEVKTAQELERRARFDELTGVFNRHELYEHLGVLSKAVQRSGTLSAIMYVDVDNLKEINDLYGHCTGDVLLQAVATRIRGALRASDVIGRIGGDEFLVILRGVHGQDDAVSVAEKVRESVSSALPTPAGRVEPSVSVGVALCTGEHDPDTLVAMADEALRTAKGTGRNQVVII